MAEKSILFLLTPKSQVVCAQDDFTLRQVVEKMDYHHFSAIPILTSKGTYAGTVTEGDLLWYIRDRFDLNFKEAEKTPLKDVPLRRTYKPVTVNTPLNGLIEVAASQNFVPVVDDEGIFIGIVTRQSIIRSVIDGKGQGKETKD